MDLCHTFKAVAAVNAVFLVGILHELSEQTGLCEFCIVDGHNAHLYRHQFAVKVHSDGKTSDLTDFADHALDVFLQILKTAFKEDRADKLFHLKQPFRSDIIFGKRFINTRNAVHIDIQFLQTVDELPHRGSRGVLCGFFQFAQISKLFEKVFDLFSERREVIDIVKHISAVADHFRVSFHIDHDIFNDVLFKQFSRQLFADKLN